MSNNSIIVVYIFICSINKLKFYSFLRNKWICLDQHLVHVRCTSYDTYNEMKVFEKMVMIQPNTFIFLPANTSPISNWIYEIVARHSFYPTLTMTSCSKQTRTTKWLDIKKERKKGRKYEIIMQKQKFKVLWMWKFMQECMADFIDLCLKNALCTQHIYVCICTHQIRCILSN